MFHGSTKLKVFGGEPRTSDLTAHIRFVTFIGFNLSSRESRLVNFMKLNDFFDEILWACVCVCIAGRWMMKNVCICKIDYPTSLCLIASIRLSYCWMGPYEMRGLRKVSYALLANGGERKHTRNSNNNNEKKMDWESMQISRWNGILHMNCQFTHISTYAKMDTSKIHLMAKLYADIHITHSYWMK